MLILIIVQAVSSFTTRGEIKRLQSDAESIQAGYGKVYWVNYANATQYVA